MSATLAVITDGEEEPQEFAVALEDVYQVAAALVLPSAPLVPDCQRSTSALSV
jgi:hypothetical protein